MEPEIGVAELIQSLPRLRMAGDVVFERGTYFGVLTILNQSFEMGDSRGVVASPHESGSKQQCQAEAVS